MAIKKRGILIRILNLSLRVDPEVDEENNESQDDNQDGTVPNQEPESTLYPTTAFYPTENSNFKKQC